MNIHLKPIEQLYILAGVCSLEANIFLTGIHFRVGEHATMPTFIISEKQLNKLQDIILNDFHGKITMEQNFFTIVADNFEETSRDTIEEAIINFFLNNWNHKYIDHYLISQEIKQKVHDILEV